MNNHQMMREIMENCILKIILLSLTSQLPAPILSKITDPYKPSSCEPDGYSDLMDV